MSHYLLLIAAVTFSLHGMAGAAPMTTSIPVSGFETMRASVDLNHSIIEVVQKTSPRQMDLMISPSGLSHLRLVATDGQGHRSPFVVFGGGIDRAVGKGEIERLEAIAAFLAALGQVGMVYSYGDVVLDELTDRHFIAADSVRLVFNGQLFHWTSPGGQKYYLTLGNLYDILGWQRQWRRHTAETTNPRFGRFGAISDADKLLGAQAYLAVGGDIAKLWEALLSPLQPAQKNILTAYVERLDQPQSTSHSCAATLRASPETPSSSGRM